MSEMNDFIASIKNSEIYPAPDAELIKEFLMEYNPKLVTDDLDLEDLDEVPEAVSQVLKEVFVLKNLKIPSAIKARFALAYDDLEWLDDYSIENKKQTVFGLDVPYILKNDDSDEILWIVFIEYLDSIRFNQIELNLKKFLELKNNPEKASDPLNELETPHEILFLAGKLDRNFALKHNILHIGAKDIKISYCIEYIDPNRPFNNDDWIIIGDERIRGFNFDSIDSVIALLKQDNGPGQYTIMSESISGEKQVLWEGLIYPKRLIEKNKMGMNE